MEQVKGRVGNRTLMEIKRCAFGYAHYYLPFVGNILFAVLIVGNK